MKIKGNLELMGSYSEEQLARNMRTCDGWEIQFNDGGILNDDKGNEVASSIMCSITPRGGEDDGEIHFELPMKEARFLAESLLSMVNNTKWNIASE